MNLRWSSVLSLVVLTGAAWIAAPAAQAQEQNQSQSGPPKYIYEQDLSIKPASMAQFEKLQQDEDAAMRAAKAPGYFFSDEQITGTGQISFVSWFSSFAEAQKNHDAVWSNPQLAATMKTDNAAQAPMVRHEFDRIYAYRKSLSLHEGGSLLHARFFRITVVHVRPGHAEEFEDIAKAEAKALASNPNVHWAVFEEIYGPDSGNTYIISTHMKSLSEIDTMFANEKSVRGELGEGLLHLVRASVGRSILSSNGNLYAISPKMSYVPDAWLTASPDFWGKK